jgi:hypothetical protein
MASMTPAGARGLELRDRRGSLVDGGYLRESGSAGIKLTFVAGQVDASSARPSTPA